MLDYTAIAAEYFGTFLLVLTILSSGGSPIFIGLALAVIVFLIGKRSGGHVNPAVSLTMYMKGALSVEELLAYCIAQLLGGVSSLYTYRTFA